MSAPNDAGPAFPYAFEHREPPQTGFAPGMTLRDWFAGQALVGSMASDTPNWSTENEVRAKNCYKIADAMFAERAKRESAK